MTRTAWTCGRAAAAGLSIFLLQGLGAPARAAVCTGVSEATNTTMESVVVVTGLTGRPLYVTSPPGDTQRIFVLEQNGFIRIKKKGIAGTTLFLDIDAKVDSTSDEMGLLGLAFDPDYATNGRFYVNYTETNPTRFSVIARYTVSGNPDQADALSEVRLFRFAQPETNHNGGWMAFGPDGYLYINTGDGGGAGDNHGTCGNGQSRTTLLGKVLRIDVRGIAPSFRNPDCGLAGANYTIPQDNPFDDGAGGLCDEIWAYGLRNPWRSSFDQGTGDFYLADVGQGCWEEVNYLATPGNGGQNFGWRQMEGNHCYNPLVMGCDPGNRACAGSPNCQDPIFTDPIHEYSNAGASECAITGGYVYRGCRMPSIRGKYFYGDYCVGSVRSFVVTGGVPGTFENWTTQVAPGGVLAFGLTSFGEDEQGELYVTDRNTPGEVRKFVPPITTLQVSGVGAGEMFLLDKTGPWTWENFAAATDIPVSFYRVYRGQVNGAYDCVLNTPTPSWPAGGDPLNPAADQLFAYVVTAVRTSFGETPTGTSGTFNAATCP